MNPVRKTERLVRKALAGVVPTDEVDARIQTAKEHIADTRYIEAKRRMILARISASVRIDVPTKPIAILRDWSAALRSTVCAPALSAAMPPARPAPRDRVHYYSDGQKHVVDLETNYGL